MNSVAHHGAGDHFVPDGWEGFDRGLCRCGAVVAWDEEKDEWQPDPSLRVLVLTSAESAAVLGVLNRHFADPRVTPVALLVGDQLELQQPWEGDE